MSKNNCCPNYPDSDTVNNNFSPDERACFGV